MPSSLAKLDDEVWEDVLALVEEVVVEWAGAPRGRAWLAHRGRLGPSQAYVTMDRDVALEVFGQDGYGTVQQVDVRMPDDQLEQYASRIIEKLEARRERALTG